MKLNSDELSALHAQSMQLSGQLNSRQIREVLTQVEYSAVSDFVGLRERLDAMQLSNAYPDEKSWNGAFDIRDKSENAGIALKSIVSNSYPNALKAIDNAPNVLHVKGDVSSLNKLPGVAIVGSRKVTLNGAKITDRISSFLADEGWVIVSGLALGVDAAAHKGALSTSAECPTIAVLAHGLEVAKPAANSRLGAEILERGGLWVSEHAIGTPARPAQFVARNRIQLGLSVGSIIIEAEPKSGSITQAKFCLKQKRPLFAVVPHKNGNPLGLLSSGTELIVNELGGIPIRTRDDYPKMLARLNQQRLLLSS
jgi:DNA processing protein